MSRSGTYLTLALFVLGFGTGALANGLGYRPTDQGPFPTLALVEEPGTAARVASAISANDARQLAKVLETEMLNELKPALTPIIDVTSIKFVGATQQEDRVLAAYVAQGRDADGDKIIRGFVMRVRGDEIVGIN